ncbi:DUF6785 family protein [Desulfopila inferna]|uniref:DUF6785 family protein n=1 Tax=Desulfopila inferna TaxID=468528 RepID=UPI0019668297|nr:DUF6785 family protein [Desulfopila inferna]MBM9605530.1 hypothetical protein [Desulfopila inferna]
MAEKQGHTIRLRAIIVGVVFAMIICLLTPVNNIYHQATPLGGGHFPLAPFFIFFLLALIITLLNRFLQSRMLLGGYELIVIWVQMVIGSGIAYTGFARTFLINLTAPVHFATVGNMWEDKLLPLLPRQLIPEEGAIRILYKGIEGGRDMDWRQLFYQIPWEAWLTPMLLWSIFILLSFLVMFCIVNILSRQWIHNERINFPLLKVPEMIGAAVNDKTLGSLLLDRFLLAGLSIPLFLHLLNGAAFYFPSVPNITTLVLAGGYFPDYGLFSGFQKLRIYFYPAFIGFAFLASRQISFSFWFFYLAGCLLYGILNVLGFIIPVSELGVTFGPTLSRPEEMQMIGAYGVFFFFLVWLARHHLMEVTRASLFLKKRIPSGTEWFDVRLAFWGTLGGMAALVFWYMQMGVNIISAILMVSFFFMIMIVATRIICQGGLAYFTLTAAPLDGIIALFGPKLFAGVSGVLAGMSQKTLFVDLRESLMPSLVHGRKVHHGNNPALLLFAGLVITVIFSLAASFIAMMMLCYRYGMRALNQEWATGSTVAVYENIFRLVTTPPDTGTWVLGFAFFGALLMLMLVIAYHRFIWWPIHPIGYLTAYSSAMRILWLSFFIGWVCNVLCMRYGGIRFFKKFQLFFVGLIIGDFLMGGGWAIVGLFTDIGYKVLPD